MNKKLISILAAILLMTALAACKETGDGSLSPESTISVEKGDREPSPVSYFYFLASTVIHGLDG